ncbi:MAG TPA: response regulator [Candidatus Polarisedimenticolia bacterium]|jgi:DNA-binding response OmpR family regulator|nr:response regulator [Candidatus Polarisedimenticolia bacterium]
MNDPVLIVDDSLTVRMDLAEAFSAAGFRPLPCGSAGEARQILARERVAIVILDVLLPDADGIEFFQEVRASPSAAGAPVLLLSTEAEVRDRIRGLSSGADEYIGKPYDAGYVVSRARELVRQIQAPGGSGKATVLVIDDSPTVRGQLKEALEALGYEVAVAASGEEGLLIASGSRPNAILMDAILPGIDGATVVRRLRLDAALRRTPCLLMTASEAQEMELQALDAGADGFVRKEENLSVMLARLAAVLRNAGQESCGPGPASLLGPKKILAVDDSPTYLQELASTLRGEGYDTVLAPSGEAALQHLAVQPVDCILLDLRMPGLGGQETCRRIKASTALRDIPLIMLTAVEDRQTMIEGLAAGADDFIAKSGDFQVLKARVRAQIRRRQFEDENRRMRDQLLRTEMEAAEARAARALAETRAVLLEEVERKNKELEAFSYSVSHDLRAPLRSIGGFSHILMEECRDNLSDSGRDALNRIVEASARMSQLIDGLLNLSRLTRANVGHQSVDLSSIAREIVAELRQHESDRQVECVISEGAKAEGDPALLRLVLQNLLGNAWKFTGKRERARIEFGIAEESSERAFFVRDNGAGFDMSYAGKLFGAFQRLHHQEEFPGIGIGLATVRRIVDRHGGRVWAVGAPDRGATIFFTVRNGGSNGRKVDHGGREQR